MSFTTDKLPSSIEEWFTYLNGINPNYINLGLDRVKSVADKMKLDNHLYSKIITVAGTNGKGSTAHMIASILNSAGVTTGLYTSPHILRFNERIIVDGIEASDNDLCTAFEAVYKAEDKNNPLTFFEFTTLAALYIFKSYACEVLILEVGLGGRLDATNILDADIAVIPSIGLDHCHILGNTTEEIAVEKAGIIKDSTEAVFIGTNIDSEAKNIIKEKADVNHCVVHELGGNLKYRIEDETHISILAPFELLNLEVPILPLINVPLAVGVVTLLNIAHKFNIMEQDIRYGLKKTKLHGRFERISSEPEVFIDVAHNPPAAKYLGDSLRLTPNKERYAVVGMLKDKDIKSTLANVVDCFKKYFICSLPGERGSNFTMVKEALLANGVAEQDIICSDTAGDAYDKAVAQLPKDGMIVVFGSFITVEMLLKDKFTNKNI